MPKHFQLSQAVAFFQTIQLLRLSSLLKHDNLWSSRKEIVCINFQNESDHPVFSQYILSLGSKIRGKKAKYQDQCLCKSNHCWHYTRGQLNRNQKKKIENGKSEIICFRWICAAGSSFVYMIICYRRPAGLATKKIVNVSFNKEIHFQIVCHLTRRKALAWIGEDRSHWTLSSKDSRPIWYKAVICKTTVKTVPRGDNCLPYFRFRK